jgi:transposase InsO family protein
LILDVWNRSELAGSDFADLVGVSTNTLYNWRRRYEKDGPEGLFGKPRGPAPGSKVDPITRRAILLIKQDHPDYGCERISQLLYRGPGLNVSPGAVANLLKEEGYEPYEVPVRNHDEKIRRFERSSPNQMWQTDLFTFILKRRKHRVHLSAFMDDHSRFITGYGLASSPTSAFILEVLRSAIGNYGFPEEILTDNGPQFHTWRGKTAFEKELKKAGVKHILSRPKHPQTLGKVERFWKTLWKECLEKAVFTDINDARTRIGHYIDHYNFQRTHQGIDGLVPADRFFGAENEVRATLEKRVAANALEIACSGKPADPFYLSGRVGGMGVSMHAEGEKLVMTTESGRREEFPLRNPEEEEVPQPSAAQGLPQNELPPPDTSRLRPGESLLDKGLRDLAAGGVEISKRTEEVDHGQEG